MASPPRSQTGFWSGPRHRPYRLYGLPGVAEARIVGGRRPEYHVLVDLEANGYGLP